MNPKLQTAAVSLVGAIPGLILSIVLVIGFINYFENMGAMYITIAAVTLVMSAGLFALPVAVVVFGPKAEAEEAETAEAAAETGEEEPGAAVVEEEEPEAVAEDEEEVFAEAEEEIVAESGDELDLEEPENDADDLVAEADDDDDFDIDEFLDEDEK